MLDKMVVHNATILRSLPNFVDPSSFLRDLCPTPWRRAGPASNLDTVSALLSCHNQKGEREPRRRDVATAEAALVEQFSRKEGGKQPWKG